MSLEAEIRALTDEVKTLATIARAIVAGRSLNADTAAPADTTAPEAPTTVTPEETPSPTAPAPATPARAEAAAPAAPEPVEDPAEAPKAELTPEAATPAAEVENAPKDHASFMAALRDLTAGRSDGQDIMRAALEAIGASSFRTLDSARYAEALAAVKAELAKAEA